MSIGTVGSCRPLRFAATAVIVWLTAGPTIAPAQDDLAPSRQALADLESLPAAVQQVQAVIRATNFGPFNISGSCGYDNNWYCFGDCRTSHWGWTFPGFVWLKDALAERFAEVSTVSGRLDASFAPVRSWLLDTLPQFMSGFYLISKEMRSLEAVITSPASSPEQKAAAAQTLPEYFEGLKQLLDFQSDQLRTAVIGLSNYNAQLNGALGQIAELRQAMDQRVAYDTEEMNKKMAEWPCGGDDARN